MKIRCRVKWIITTMLKTLNRIYFKALSTILNFPDTKSPVVVDMQDLTSWSFFLMIYYKSLFFLCVLILIAKLTLWNLLLNRFPLHIARVGEMLFFYLS